MPPLELVPVDPLSEDPVQRQRFGAAVAIQIAASEAVWGAEASGWTEAEVLGRRRGEGWSFVDRLAERDGRPVGMSALAMPLRDNTSLALLMLVVHPEYRRQGVGSALFQQALAEVTARGRTILQVDTEWPEGGVDDSGEQFAALRGFAPAQTTVRSAMPLPADEVRLRAYASGDGVEDAAAFEVETAWEMPPEGWLDDLALLKQRMSTDVPLGETSKAEEIWDAARVTQDYSWAAEVGRRTLTAVARDLSTGGLVGFTYLQVPRTDPTLAYQQDTLVVREARGNRIGIRLKAAAALELMREQPEVTRIRTWNADDNGPMLEVNSELGYRPEGYLRVWERRLDRA